MPEFIVGDEPVRIKGKKHMPGEPVELTAAEAKKIKDGLLQPAPKANPPGKDEK